MGDPATAPADRELAARCDPIELLISDVNGVLTDGVIALDAQGAEIKHFHVRDGLGYALWHRAGKRSAILSGRRAPAVERRAAELSIAHVLQGHDAKAGPFRELVGRLGLEPRQVCYVGDDLPDLPVLRAVGLAACPADAVAEVRGAAHIVTRAPEGAAPSARSSRSSSGRRGSGTAWSIPGREPRPRSAVRTRAAGRHHSPPVPSPVGSTEPYTCSRSSSRPGRLSPCCSGATSDTSAPSATWSTSSSPNGPTRISRSRSAPPSRCRMPGTCSS